MKRYLVIDDEGQDLEAALRLLREHGFTVSGQAGGTVAGKEAGNESGRMRTVCSALRRCTREDIRTAGEAVLSAGAVDGNVLELSASFSELTGYGREELVGQPMLGLTFFLNPESWSDALAVLTEGNTSVELETRILRRDGLVSFAEVFICHTEMDGIPCHLLTFREKGPNASVGRLGEMRGYSIADPESPMSGDRDLSRQEIGGMIDYHALQDLMNSFHKATKLPMAITDINGNVLVAIGWQEICTRFHRLHPETLKNCMESDTYVTRNITEGKYSLYRCRNNMWDIATPIIIGGKHIANIFMGQFLFDDEVPDYDLFRKQAQTYGFDEKEYLAALDRVPRWSRKTIESSMEFFTKLAMLISRISIGNIQLSQALARQKVISEELQQANLVVENSPVVLFRWRATEGWPVELVSRNIIQFGYTPEELLSGSVQFEAMVHPEDRERVVAEVRAYSSKGVDNFQQEYRIAAKNGEIYWVYNRTVIERDGSGEIRSYQGIAIDITGRKRAEEEIRRLKNYLSNIIDSMPSILVGIDRDETVTQWNRQAETFSGVSAAEAVGKPITELLPDFSPWIEAMRDGIDRRRPSSMEKLLIEKEGERRFYDVMLYPLTGNGEDGAVVRIEDATERARIQELMIQAEKMISIGGLAAGMAHEINNPLGIITQAVQNIERRVSPGLAANREAAEGLGVSLEGINAYFRERLISEFIGSIREASRRASRIIVNMLEFSHRAGTAMQAVSPAGIIEQALELAAGDYDLKKKFDFRSIEIIRDYAPDMPQVPMVALEMEQVMLNLLKNAAQAMIVNPPDHSPRITLRLRREERYALIEVEDNGPGMKEEVRRRAFEPFFTTKAPGTGTGLGLSVSYMIVTQNHKGLMEVESKPGKGACFRVRLPLAS